MQRDCSINSASYCASFPTASMGAFPTFRCSHPVAVPAGGGLSGLDLSALDPSGLDLSQVQRSGINLPPGLRKASGSSLAAGNPTTDDKQLPPGLRGRNGKKGR
jgi:hypothetical protein